MRPKDVMKWGAVAILSLGMAAIAAVAGEWTNWRGPHQNGTSDETGLVDTWSLEGENFAWRADFIGRSTPVVFDGRACAIGRTGTGIDRRERVACFDAADGSLLWEDIFNVYNTTVPFNRVGWASLAADAETGMIYAHGVAGQLHAYAADGELVWSHFLVESVGRASGYGGRTQTPIVDGDQLILSYVSAGWGEHAAPRHRTFSFDKRTGEIRWISTPGGFPKDMNTQSVPVIHEINGQRLIIGGNADGWIYALRAIDGAKVWSYHLSQRGINSTVLVDGNRVYASHSEENLDDATMGRLVAIDATGKGDVTASAEIWRINELASGFPSPTLKDGVLYVVDNSANMHAVDAAGGKRLWEHSVGTVGKGSPVWADGKLYVTEVNGRFHILEPGKDGIKVLDTEEDLKSEGDRYAEIYGSPAVAYGRVYFATEGGIYCLGEKSTPVEVPPRAKRPKTAKSKAAAATLLVVPGDVMLAPGESLDFKAQALDVAGRTVRAKKLQWSVEGLQADLSPKGRLTAHESVAHQAGKVTAKLGDLTASARVRIVPPLPWEIDFDDLESGSVPPTWVNARGKFRVDDVDGNKVLNQFFRERGLLRMSTYMGPSDWTNYTVQADVKGNRVRRRKTDAGVIAAGYTLDMQGNAQKLQIRTWPSEERVAKDVPFEWEMQKWYTLKLRVEHLGSKAVVKGKAWSRGESEPAGWMIVVEDPYPIAGGSPGLVGYTPADLYYDNVKVMVNE